LLEIFVEEPGAGRPSVVSVVGAFAAVKLFGGFYGFGKKFVEVAVEDVGLRVDEASVEVAFEDDEDALNLGRRRRWSCGGSLEERCCVD